MSESPADELKALKAKREALKAKRVERDAPASVEAQLAEERRQFALEQATFDAESAHGELNRKIAVVHFRRADGSTAGSCIVKKPNHQIFRRFQMTDAEGAKAKTDQIDKLIAHCLVWPDVETYEQLVEEFPATPVKIATVISRLAGFGGEEVAGK